MPQMMHKRFENILIIGVILIAAIYAAISFWPDETPTPQQPAAIEVPQKNQAADKPPDIRQMEAKALANLIKIGSAELSFHRLRGRWGAFQDLVQENLLDSAFTKGTVIYGYQYSLQTGGEHFACFADPDEPGRHFFIDETLDLRYDDYGRASASSPYLVDAKNEAVKNND
jgi:hypothetical protein